MPEQDQYLEDADWLAEDPSLAGYAWRGHLRRQMGRTAVAVLIALAVMGLKTSGTAGRWLTARLRSAVTADTSYAVRRVLGAPRSRSLLAGLRQWLGREWQVNGTSLARSADYPPPLIWPVTDARPMAAGTASPADRPALDLQIPSGTPVLAAASGVVTGVEGTGGQVIVTIGHGGGWKTVYGRCQGAFVAAGATVAVGQAIALVGSAPPPVPSHLHFEVWGPDGPVDPLPMLRANGTGVGTV